MPKSASWVGVVLAFFLVIPPSVKANLVINEIFYDAIDGDVGNEWVEIYNPDSQTYDITGWKFTEAGTNHNLTLLKATAGIGPGSYAIIADDGFLFLQNHPQYLGTLFDSSFSLSNTGESIALTDSYLNQVDQVTYSSAWGVGEGYSLERISPAGGSNDPANWQSGPLDGSPGQSNSAVPTPTLTPAPTPEPTAEPTSIPELTPTPGPTLIPTSAPTPPPVSTPTPEPSLTPSPTPVLPPAPGLFPKRLSWFINFFVRSVYQNVFSQISLIFSSLHP